MNNTLIVEKIQQILRSNFSWITGDVELTTETRFIEDLRLDSINLVTLQVAVEDEFNLRFDPGVVDLAVVFSSVGEMARFIGGELRSQNAAEG